MSQTGKQLKVVNLEKTFFSKITDSISKILLPTKLNFNSIMISVKRNTMIRAFLAYKQDSSNKDETLLNKYENTYSLYLEAVDKFIMESIYKKVKKNMATSFESNALSKYYNVVHLKETEYTEYKHQKQKYLIDLDYEIIKSDAKGKIIENFQTFYAYKMEAIYKALLKHYSIQLADNSSKDENKKQEIYNKIFVAIEEYIKNVLPIKEDTKNKTEIMSDFAKLEKFAGNVSHVAYIEKNMVLLGISRNLFSHSFPMVAAEECYEYLLTQTRKMLKDSKENKENIFNLFITLTEDYNIRLLSTKVYWDKPSDRQNYKEFWEKYKNISENKKNGDMQKQKTILFLKYDLKQQNSKTNADKTIIKIFKEKLVELGAMKQFKNTAKTFTVGVS